MDEQNGIAYEPFDTNHIYREQRMEKIYVYCGIVVAVIVLMISRNYMYVVMCLRASKRLHNRLFTGITHAKMSFFGTNASGLIINRFAKDMGIIDVYLPFSLHYTLNVCIKLYLCEKMRKENTFLIFNRIIFFFSVCVGFRL